MVEKIACDVIEIGEWEEKLADIIRSKSLFLTARLFYLLDIWKLGDDFVDG